MLVSGRVTSYKGWENVIWDELGMLSRDFKTLWGVPQTTHLCCLWGFLLSGFPIGVHPLFNKFFHNDYAIVLADTNLKVFMEVWYGSFTEWLLSTIFAINMCVKTFVYHTLCMCLLWLSVFLRAEPMNATEKVCPYKAVREIHRSFNWFAFGMVLLGIVILCHHLDEDLLLMMVQKFDWHQLTSRISLYIFLRSGF